MQKPTWQARPCLPTYERFSASPDNANRGAFPPIIRCQVKEGESEGDSIERVCVVDAAAVCAQPCAGGVASVVSGMLVRRLPCFLSPYPARVAL